MSKTSLFLNAILPPAFVLGVAVLAGICAPCPGLGAEPLPEPPLIAPIPDPSAWTINVEQKKPHRKEAGDPAQTVTRKRLADIYPPLVKVTVERVGKEWHREKFFGNQKRENIWLYRDFVIYQFHNFSPEQVNVTPIDDINSPAIGAFGPDFPELTWIRPDVFVKTVMYHGQRCHYYEDKNAPPLEGGDALNPAEPKGVRAWINIKTRLPVAVEDAAILETYTYSKAPASIQPSGIFAAAYKNATSHKEDSPADP